MARDTKRNHRDQRKDIKPERAIRPHTKEDARRVDPRPAPNRARGKYV